MKAKMTIPLMSVVGALVVAGLLLAGCGGSSSSTSTSGEVSTAPSAGSTTASQEAAPQGAGSEAAPSEAQAAATGDIPDNQVFLLFRDPQAGYSIRYPEGWARKGSGNNVTFQEKANVVQVSVRKGAAHGKPGTKTTYSRRSAPDPVTGKRLPLTIDRYEFPHGGKVAVVDLVTPVGVDNVDAYRMISESFKWLK
ncbi:MAG: lipoprotein [Solirubrobacterales bacterium]|nr:lipoprotein [Solirubrobacterales bacterium]